MRLLRWVVAGLVLGVLAAFAASWSAAPGDRRVGVPRAGAVDRPPRRAPGATP